MPPSAEPTIQITVLDDRRSEECEAGCGMDWSSPESQTLARQRIKDGFGDRVKIEYLNLSGTEARAEMLKWRGVIQTGNLALPLLLLDGHLRIAGPFDLRQLIETIEIEAEMGIRK